MLQLSREESSVERLQAGACGGLASRPVPRSVRSSLVQSSGVHALSPLRRVELARPAPDPERVGFERAVTPCLPALRGRALRMARSRGDADDLVQETVLRAWRFWPRYTERDCCRAWLQRILMNTFVSLRRRAARERAVLALAERALGAEPSRQLSAASEPGADALDDRLSAGLSTLAAEQRRVLWLVDVQERSYREAAHELGWPIGTVMSRLHRARAALRRHLVAALAAPKLDAALSPAHIPGLF